MSSDAKSDLSSRFAGLIFHPVLELPSHLEVFDFTGGYDPTRPLATPYGIGRYNEKRPGMYETELFVSEREAPRDIHIGIDLAAPVGAPVFAFFSGEIFLTAINAQPGDYGGTVITRHVIDGASLFALHGHLSHHSTRAFKPGQCLSAGDTIGWLGNRDENGGWNSHLHFQLSWLEPKLCDMPGAVNSKDLAQALIDYPDPRLVLGPLY